MAPRPYTPEEVLALPASVPIPDVARALGISKEHAYDLIREDEFPLRVLQLGKRYKVTRTALLEYLEIRDPDVDESDEQATTPTGTAPRAARVVAAAVA